MLNQLNKDPNYNIKKTEEVTELILNLSNEIVFPNNWNLKDFLIHLHTVDLEWIDQINHVLDKKVRINQAGWAITEIDKLPEDELNSLDKKYLFGWDKMNVAMNEWNIQTVEKYQKYSLDDMKSKFKESRKHLVEELIKISQIIEDHEALFENIISLWYHDKSHLAKVNIQFD